MKNLYIRERIQNMFRLKAILLFLADIIVIQIASFLALYIRFDFSFDRIDKQYLEMVMNYTLVHTIIILIVFGLCRLYAGVWKYASADELFNIMLACIIVFTIDVTLAYITKHNLPRSFYPIFTILLMMGTFFIRFSYRFLRLMKSKIGKSEGSNVMVIGAGSAGHMIVKELKTVTSTRYNVRCVIDDSSIKRGMFVQGVKIIGGRNEIIRAVEKYEIDDIVIAMPSASKKTIREIVDICKDTGCKLKILPGMYQFVSGDVSISKLREVSIDDLLGREQVRIDNKKISRYVEGKVVMVTGGGGSIGSELCRQIAKNKPKQLIVVDIYENNAYDIQQELKRTMPELNLVALIASVRNTNRMDTIFKTYKPNIVFHAAAHKHVPLMEDAPCEAIKNNVFGTYKTAMAAAKYGVDKFVLISTDKAVNPTNIMGASKRICEMIVQMLNRQFPNTEYVAVRFGNVLGSNGSVIPLFKKQIAEGGPITVTDPNIIRYFMTIPEAVSLVLEAGAYAKGGEIFVLDMGEPVKILDLAKNLIRLSGYTTDEIEIKFTGLRPGEKLYEEMLMAEEGLKDTENHLIHIGQPLEFNEDEFRTNLINLEKAAKSDSENIRELVKEIVPTYVMKKTG